MIRSIRHSLWFLLLFRIVTCALWAQHHELDENIRRKEEDLQQIRTQIEECRQELGLLHGREATLLDSFRTAEKERSLLQKLLHELVTRQQELKRDIDLTNEERTTTEKRLENQRQRLARRLRTLYKRGRFHILEVLCTAHSPVDLFRRYKYAIATAEADRNILLGIERERKLLEAIRKELTAKLAENTRLRHEKEEEGERMQRLQNQRNRHIALVQTQLSTSNQVLKQLEEEATSLETIIERLEDERKRLATQKKVKERVQVYENFAQYRGQLPWPLQGQIIVPFGLQKHPIFKTVTINKGIDIQAPLGTEIHAVAPGNVIMTDWLRGYGKFLILDHHGGYYTLYAHTSEIHVVEGDEVESGQLIAKVGDTGSMHGSMLHFEIRKGKKELDPMLWLRRE